MGLTVFARVWLPGQDGTTVDRFTKRVERLPEVVERRLMAGDCDFLLRLVASASTLTDRQIRERNRRAPDR